MPSEAERMTCEFALKTCICFASSWKLLYDKANYGQPKNTTAPKEGKQVQSKQCAKVICLQTSSWKGGFSGIFISSRLYLLAYRAVGQLVEPASGLLDAAASGREPRREQESLWCQPWQNALAVWALCQPSCAAQHSVLRSWNKNVVCGGAWILCQ